MDNDDHKAGMTRREIMGGAALGFAAAAAAGPAIGQDASQPAEQEMPPQAVPGNPVTRYPAPPLPEQTQDWPGLASPMEPRPDHGEQSYRGSGRLMGRKALITGGDSGIGRAAAIAFAREGADVAFGYLPQEQPDADEVIQLIEAEGRKAVPLPGDIQDEAFCQQMVQKAVDQLGGLDIVVNNAARQTAQTSLADITTEQFDRTFKTNVYAPFWITKAALPHLTAGAAIIFTTSEQAYDPSETIIDYAQTKACLANFTRSLAKSLAKQGIRVNGVAPGPFWTPLQPTGGQLPGKLPQFGADTPMGRPGQPAELGPVYVILASNEFSYGTGQIFGENGGRGVPG